MAVVGMAYAVAFVAGMHVASVQIRRLVRRRWRSPKRTLVDAPDVKSVVDLVRRLDRGEGADALADSMERLLRAFPPDEATMQRLSVLQQRHEGEGGAREYSVMCMYAVANEVVSSGVSRGELVRCYGVV